MKNTVGTALLVIALLVSSTAIPVVAGSTIINGSFENGDYIGWILLEDGNSPPVGTWGIAQDGDVINPGDQTWDFCDEVFVTQNSPGLPITYSPTDGEYLAYQLQNGPETHRMYQDVELSPYAMILTWDMQYNNHAGSFSQAQYLAVHIRNPEDDAILETLFITEELVDPHSIDIMTSFSADISDYAGSTVRLDIEMGVYLHNFDAAFDNFAITDDVLQLEVDIDIKPGSLHNSINLKSKGVIPVAILTTEGFDVMDVDLYTVAFGPAEAELVHYAMEDVDGDGDIDLILHFKTQDTGIAADDMEAILTAKTSDGTDIVGTDSVRIVPPNNKK